MPLILPGNVASATAAVTYSVANSCRFNDGDSPKMVKELGTPTDLDKWTISAWVKLGTLPIGTNRVIFQGHDDGSNYTGLLFTTAHNLEFGNRVGGTHVGRLITDREFRDPAAWYHVVAVWDSDNGTAGDRMKLYVNGVEETSFSTDTNPTSGEASSLESGHDAQISSHADGGYYMDGYMAEVCFIDGQALTPTSFGEFNSDSPTIWQPIDVSGLTFGNNGFYLDFEASDNLGNDANGGTDLAETNLAAVDQCTDSPTNNFCVMNPLDTYYSIMVMSEGNCKLTTASPWNVVSPRSTIPLTAGKWYWEVKMDVTGGGNGKFGVIGIVSTPAAATTEEVGNYADGYGYYGSTGKIVTNNAETTYGTAYDTTAVIGHYLDLDNNKMYWSKDGVIQNSGTGFSITAAASTGTGHYNAACTYWDAYATDFYYNFGNPVYTLSSAVADTNGYGSFEYDPSDGGSSSFDSSAKDFLAVCTKNLGSDGG